MSATRELESLFVRLTADAKDLSYTKIKSQVEAFAEQLSARLEEAAKIRPILLLTGFMNQVDAAANKIKTAFFNINAAVAQATGKDTQNALDVLAGRITTTADATALIVKGHKNISKTIDLVRDLAMVGSDLSAFAGGFSKTISTLAGITPGQTSGLENFITTIESAANRLKAVTGFAKDDQANIRGFAYAIETVHKTLSPITGLPGFDAFATQLAAAALKLTGITLPPGVQAFLQGIVAIANDPSLKITNPNTQGLMQFANSLVRASIEFSKVQPATNVRQFATSIKLAAAALGKTGSLPQLIQLSKDVNAAAAAFTNLNQQLAMYIAYITTIQKLGKVPIARAAAAAGGRSFMEDFAPGGVSAFGFDPIRRGIAVLTSMGTSLAIGFLGFEMVRQVTGFDKEMTEAMSTLHLNLRYHRARIGEELEQLFDTGRMARVRATVENEIMSVSRRVATSPRELAEGFRELSLAGFGTERMAQNIRTIEQFSFVGGMNMADSARELARLQRQVNMTSMDSLENANNLRRVADVVTSAALSSRMSFEIFVQGLQRLNPHVQFLNRGLEEGAGLLAAFGSIDAPTAVNRAQALLRAITTQFVRSGQPGQGDMWRVLGIAPYDSSGQFTGVADFVRQIDQLTSRMTPERRDETLSYLFPGQLRSTAMDAIRALLSSSEALETFFLAAQRADGVLDQIANQRLQSFTSQLAILKNNLLVVGVEIGKVLAPALREVNTFIVDGLDTWWEMGAAARHVVIGFVTMGLALVLFRFTLPVVLGLFKMFFLDTLINGTVVIIRVVMALSAMTTWLYATMIAIANSQALLVTFAFTWQVLVGLWTVSMFVAKGLMASFIGLGFVAMAVKGIMWLVTFVSGALSAAWTFLSVVIHWLDINLLNFVLALLSVSVTQLLTKAATWLLNAALTALSAILTYVLAITGLIIISFVLLAAVIMAAIVVANTVFVAMLATLQSIIVAVIGLVGLFADVRGESFAELWDGFLEATHEAFWATMGFFVNFRENMGLLMVWLDQNWPIIMFNITHFADVAFANLATNIQTHMARAMAGLLDMAARTIGLLVGLAAAAGNPLNWPGAWRATQQAINDFRLMQVRPLVPIDQEPEPIRQAIRAAEQAARARGAGAEEIAAAGRRAQAAAGGLRPLGALPEFNLTIPEDVREMIENLFARPRIPGMGDEGSEGAASQIGSVFKEISLRRYVLEGASTQEDVRRAELMEMERQTRLLEIIAERLGMPSAGPAMPPPVAP